MPSNIKQRIAEIVDEMIEIRQRIHTFPELYYQEQQTSALVAKHLQAYGYHVQTGVGGTGVVAILDSVKPGKTIALRADMDALPIQEETNVAYQSKNRGKMHACGHDGHTATLLTVARVLPEYIENLSGKIKFIFQPAEEYGAGAAAMIKAGVLENPKVDAIFGYHNIPGVAVGKMALKANCILVAADLFTIKVVGQGGHAALPHLAADPLYVASTIVQQLQSVVSRQMNPTEPTVLSITKFHSGTAQNVIPSQAELGGTLRTTGPEHRAKAQQKIKEIIQGIAKSFGVKIDINYNEAYPATLNWQAETDRVFAIAKEHLGMDNVLAMPAPVMAAEDFAFFLQKIPGCYFLMGNGEESPGLHTPQYNFNDHVLPVAANMLCQVVFDYAKRF